jgi:lysophospholipid acyltransferase (LPLAT)-like uncharacterized protein
LIFGLRGLKPDAQAKKFLRVASLGRQAATCTLIVDTALPTTDYRQCWHGGRVRIRSRLLNRLIGVAGAGLIVAWRQTLDLRVSCPEPKLNPYDPRYEGEYLYAAWHESILACTFFGLPALSKAKVLISQHQDGEYITQIMERLRARVVRGSTTRGGLAGLMAMANVGKDTHLAITPDGPRGPRRRLQPGAIFLASRTGLPVVPLGFGFGNAWRARSWDRFAVPLPFSVVTCVAGRSICVPPALSRSGLEDWRDQVESSMLECTAAAECWAAGRDLPNATRLAA